MTMWTLGAYAVCDAQGGPLDYPQWRGRIGTVKLLSAERNHRIDPRRAPGWPPTHQQRHDENDAGTAQTVERLGQCLNPRAGRVLSAGLPVHYDRDRRVGFFRDGRDQKLLAVGRHHVLVAVIALLYCTAKRGSEQRDWRAQFGILRIRRDSE